MAKKAMIAMLCAMLLFPLLVIAKSRGGDIKEEDREAAGAYLEERRKNILPGTKPDGTPFAIAYVDIDPYPASGEMLYYLVEQLIETGWIEHEKKLPFEPEDTDGKKLLSYLAGEDIGDFLRFADSQNYYLAVDGEKECRKRLKNAIDQKKVDLILCLGTWPGSFVKELLNDTVPVMVYFSVDPVGAGLSKSEHYSGKSNLWCHVNYTVYDNQIQFYYDNARFHKIGMVYYDENVAAMRAYREAAGREGFAIIEKKIATLSQAGKEQTEAYYKQLEDTFSQLIGEGIDAFMLNTDVIKEESRIRPLLSAFYEKNIPVFVQNGEHFVKNGALMLVTASDAREQAPFVAEVFARILGGEEPGSIDQVFITAPYLSLNLDAADRIGYRIKEELLLSAEKIYGASDGR